MNVEQEIQALVERNKRVEADKSWEVSLTRRVFIATVTYIAAALWMNFQHAEQPFVGALLPAFGYLLSTIAVPFVRVQWERNNQALNPQHEVMPPPHI